LKSPEDSKLKRISAAVAVRRCNVIHGVKIHRVKHSARRIERRGIKMRHEWHKYVNKKKSKRKMIQAKYLQQQLQSPRRRR